MPPLLSLTHVTRPSQQRKRLLMLQPQACERVLQGLKGQLKVTRMEANGMGGRGTEQLWYVSMVHCICTKRTNKGK